MIKLMWILCVVQWLVGTLTDHNWWCLACYACSWAGFLIGQRHEFSSWDRWLKDRRS